MNQAVDFRPRPFARALQLLGMWCSLCGVNPYFGHLGSFPTWLRYVLVVVLVLTGAPPPLSMAQTAKSDYASAGAHAKTVLLHCHNPADSSRAVTVKSLQEECPCCDDSACQCGCVVTLAMPLTLLNLRDIAPDRIPVDFILPSSPSAPSSLLLRPPIA